MSAYLVSTIVTISAVLISYSVKFSIIGQLFNPFNNIIKNQFTLFDRNVKIFQFYEHLQQLSNIKQPDKYHFFTKKIFYDNTDYQYLIFYKYIIEFSYIKYKNTKITSNFPYINHWNSNIKLIIKYIKIIGKSGETIIQFHFNFKGFTLPIFIKEIQDKIYNNFIDHFFELKFENTLLKIKEIKIKN